MEQNYEEFRIKKNFTNCLLKKGEKNHSEKIFFSILKEIKKNTKQKTFFILKKAINHLKPKLKAIAIPNKKKKRKKTKKDLYFLIFLNENNQIKTAIRWLLLHEKLRKTTFIVNEIIKASQKKGKSINSKKDYYLEIKKRKYNLVF